LVRNRALLALLLFAAALCWLSSVGGSVLHYLMVQKASKAAEAGRARVKIADSGSGGRSGVL